MLYFSSKLSSGPVRRKYEIYRRIIAGQGFQALWRGFARHGALAIPRGALEFGLFETFRCTFSYSSSSLLSMCVCGGAAGFITQFALLQPIANRRYWNSVNHKRLTGSQPPGTMFSGALRTSCVAAVERGGGLGSYFYFRKEWGHWSSLPFNLALAYSANVVGSSPVFWAHTVNRRINANKWKMLQLDKPSLPIQFGTVLSEITKKEGVRSLYQNYRLFLSRGASPMFVVVLYDFLVYGCHLWER